MKTGNGGSRRDRNVVRWTMAGAMLAAVVVPARASALEADVVGPNGEAVTAFRWLLEEDLTWPVAPGDPSTNWGIEFHRSYMPVVARGDQSDAAAIPAQPDRRYYLSVLPDSDYALGGTSIGAGQATATVHVNSLPLPTAQITVLVYEDNFPINNAADLPAEHGLEGFQLVLEDAGGRYGMSAGTAMMDAFGNPLGTTYDGSGNVLVMGSGIIETDANGEATVENLSPGKYGISVVPPAGQSWIQTSTIEGKKVIDAWVKAGEPPYFAEFGPPGYHVTIGFVRPANDTTVLTGGGSITGQVVNQHLSRPPDTAFYDGAPLGHTNPWVGLNLGAAGAGRGVYAQPCAPDGTFSIDNVPPGDYQVVVWDSALDVIFASIGVTVPPDGSSVALGDVPVFQWFSRLENWVFNDKNENGFRDCATPECNDPVVDEIGIPEQAINLRWRDGSMYQSFPTDGEGFVPFDEVFPFFNWLVAEVDYGRLKATGVTVTVDAGGPIDPTDPWSFGGQLNPQPQPENGGLPYRTELGPVLLEAFQGFLGQTSVLQWGKAAYAPGENGGISGVVPYATTRAESDPRFAATEPWEPGVPGVEVNLYDVTGTVWLNSTTTDSWDATQPGGCPGDPADPFYAGAKCYDGMRNWNQVRPGVFDGGYAFTSYWVPYYGAPDAIEINGLPTGDYVVEVVVPNGYEIVKEEDRNVDFGESYTPAPQLLPPICVGNDHLVPETFSLFPLLDENGVNVPPLGAGTMRPLCDRKAVHLADGANAAADFPIFTEVPTAGHIVGMILDDTANEFDPNSVQFGEKYAPPWLPVSIRDWTGRELSRTYGDEYGRYNALVPSTFTMDRPMPSGVSPNMVTVCLNSPGSQDSVTGAFVPDPHFDPRYSQFCYTLQYMPGTTTYLDTPVVRVAAFAGPDQFPLDCRAIDGTPEIAVATGSSGGGGPWVSGPGETLTVVSSGLVEVPNPAYEGAGSGTPATIVRDFSFGDVPGQIAIGGVPLQDVAWTAGTITGTVAGNTATGELEITRGDTGLSTVMGLTIAVAPSGSVINVEPSADPAARPIQAAIDAASPGDLILVGPGNYEELVVMWKPVKLQGWGAPSTVINALKQPTEKLAEWRQKIELLVSSGAIDLLPSQEIGFGGIEPVTLFTEEGPGIIALGRNVNANRGGYGLDRSGRPNARIDGLTITGGDSAGGIIVNAYGRYLEIGNNRVRNNNGFYGGGIRVGHPLLTDLGNNGLLSYSNAHNDGVRIHHNEVYENGGLGGVGGGISVCNGAYGYVVEKNLVCGNFTMGEGAGIGHLGLNDGGRIVDNTVIFNQSFDQGATVSGGGIFVGGGAPLNGPGSLSAGTGSVLVAGNLIQGNLAGAGDGGGLRAEYVNGQDVADASNTPNKWFTLDVFDNIIVDNIAGLAGGGMSLQDVALANIVHDTVANNDSTATAGEAFSLGNPSQSTPRPAGLVAHAHSPELAAAFGNSAQVSAYREFANPLLANTILWHNRSFTFLVDQNTDPVSYLLVPDVAAGDPPVFWDAEVLGTPVPRSLTFDSCILSDTPGADPGFVAEYWNGARSFAVIPEITTAIQAPPALDEGGNFIDVHFGPLTRTDPATGDLFGDYHLTAGSTAIDAGDAGPVGDFAELATDFDGDPRPSGAAPDVGADEAQP